jgi:hypothetical protein
MRLLKVLCAVVALPRAIIVFSISALLVATSLAGQTNGQVWGTLTFKLVEEQSALLRAGTRTEGAGVGA